MQRSVTRDELVSQLQVLGVQPGGVLVAHIAFSNVRPVEGGPAGLIDALQTAVGPAGTLVMPSMADVDDEPFNPDETPCISMGIVAETFRRLPNVVRSDSPHSFAARGPCAEQITAPHPVEVPHGIDSPVGRAYELDAQVLLMGVGHDANTTIHLAENIAAVRYGLSKSAMVLRDGKVVRVDYTEVDHCCQNFALMDGWLQQRGAQRRGTIGHGEALLARSREIVEVPLDQIRERETVFLHSRGLCAECDQARATIGQTPARR